MTPCLLSLILATTQTPPLGHAYFPATPGTQWVFEEKQGTETRRVTETLQVKDGAAGFRILAESVGQPSELTGYEVRGDTLYLTFYEVGTPLPKPLPILAFTKDPEEWSYGGKITMMGTEATMDLKGKSKADKDRKFGGKTYKTVRVELNAHVVTIGGDSIRSKQIGWYGLGIGLMRIEAETQVQGVTLKSARELVEHKPGGGSGE